MNNMTIICEKPLVFLTPAAEEDSRLDFCFSNPLLVNPFDNFKTVDRLEKYLVEACYGTSAKSSKTQEESYVPVLRMNNIKNGILNFEDLVYAPLSEVSSILLKKKDILINRTNSKELVGKCAVFKGDSDYSFASYIIRLRTDTERLRPDFLVLFLSSRLGRNEIDRRSCGSANQYNISISHINSFSIPKLEVTQQDLIVSRYDKIKQLSSLTHGKAGRLSIKRADFLDTIVDSISTEIGLSKFPRPWFGRLYFLKAEAEIDRLDVLGANPQFEDECWRSGKFVPLSDVCEVDGSNEQIPLGTQRYISIDSLPGNYWGDIDLPEMEIENQTGRTHFFSGDIAWAHLKPSILKGKAYLIHDECWGSHHFLKLNTSKVPEDLRTIIWAYLKIGPIKRHLANKCTGKSESQKDVSDKALGMLPFPNFNDDQIKRVAAAIRDTIEKSHEFETQENDYKEIADNLLKKAKSNIFNLLDDSWFNDLVSEAKEALQ